MTKQPDSHDIHLAIEGLHVSFGVQAVLRDINITIPRGQTIAIIGASGCGKTVLLKTMIGLIKPTQGRVIFDGQDIAMLNEKQLTRQRIKFGFVFQNAALFDSLTVGQNIAFPLRQHTRMEGDEVEGIVRSRLNQVGLQESIIVKRPAELSGGMRKRVGLARALAMNPEIILYDEPTTGLDPIMSDVINELIIRTRKRENVTSVVVTHDMRTVERVADRVVMLCPLSPLDESESQILYDGDPQSVSSAEDPRVRQFVRGEAGERLSEIDGAA